MKRPRHNRAATFKAAIAAKHLNVRSLPQILIQNPIKEPDAVPQSM